MSRLDILDAAFHYASDDVSRDQYVLFAFAVDGDAPTFDAISEFVRARARTIPELGRRIHEVPLNLDYPRWVLDDAPTQSRVREIAATTWDGVRRRLGALLADPVDATHEVWRVHAARNVADVPQTDGNAVVVVFQVSHALVDGKGASRVARQLFAPGPTGAPALDPTVGPKRSLLPIAVGAALALPVRTASARWKARSARRAYLRAHGSLPSTRDTPRRGIRGNEEPTPARVAHVITLEPGLLAAFPLSVTTLGITAVGLAMERYLSSIGEPAPENLNCLVPMALPDGAEWPAVNRLINGTVDLHVTIDDLPERARRIKASLAEARAATADSALHRWITAENLIPAPIFLAASRRTARRARANHGVPDSVLTNTTVVSVNRGSADLELLGGPAIFSAGFPMLGPSRSVTHGFYGLGDAMTVTVVACPDTFPDHDRYAEMLRTAVEDVAAATA